MTQALAEPSDVIERVLRHVDDNTTDLAGEVWREPVENYLSPTRFEAEVAIMRRTPTPFCPSAAVPDAGSFHARDAGLTPLVAVRGADGVARVFRNACRHRGAQLLEGSGCKATLTCRYHAWTYGLDGRLRGVPHEHGFPGLDKSSHGLVPVAAVERHGMIYVTQDGSALSEAEADATPDLFGPEWRFVEMRTLDVPANWKVVVEGVLEGYHVRFVHPETFYPVQYDNIALVEDFGRNTRVTFPFKALERQRPLSPAERSTERAVTHVYHLFPNTAVGTFPAHRSLAVYEPLAIDRTRIVTYDLTTLPDDDAGRTAFNASRDFLAQGNEEDLQLQASVQRGLAANANSAFTFGLFEGAISRFHKHMAEAIDGAGEAG